MASPRSQPAGLEWGDDLQDGADPCDARCQSQHRAGVAPAGLVTIPMEFWWSLRSKAKTKFFLIIYASAVTMKARGIGWPA
jgi:hypothetical protein